MCKEQRTNNSYGTIALRICYVNDSYYFEYTKSPILTALYVCYFRQHISVRIIFVPGISSLFIIRDKRGFFFF